MENGTVSSSSLLRLIGIMGVGVGLTWAFQILGFSFGGSALDRLTWVLAAASVCGASFGLIVVSGAITDEEPAMNSDRVLS